MTSPDIKHDHITHKTNGFSITYTVTDQSRREMLTYRLRTNYGSVTDEISADDQEINIEAVPRDYAEEIANRFEYWESTSGSRRRVGQEPTTVEDQLDEIERTHPSIICFDDPSESPAADQLVYTNPPDDAKRTVIGITVVANDQPRQSAMDILVGCFTDTPFVVELQDIQCTTHEEHPVWAGALQLRFSDS